MFGIDLLIDKEIDILFLIYFTIKPTMNYYICLAKMPFIK